MKTIRKLKWMLVVVLLGWANVTLAQTRVNWSGNIPGQTITTNTIVTITGNVNLQGTIDIAEGKTLTINTNGNYTIKRSGFDGFMFRAGMYDGNTPSSQKIAHLTINGGDYTLTIDGGIEFNTANDACSGLKNDVVPTTNIGAMLGCNGHLNLTNLVLQNIYNPADHGGILCWNINTNTYYDCNVKNCTIRGFYCGSLFYFIDGDAHTANFTDVTFTGNDTRYNTAYGGCIRTNGGTRTSITIKRGRIHHNITRFGMIHYNALGTASTKCTIMGNLEIDHNESLATAGAIFNCAKMTISSANIHHNTAATEGGAIRMNAYTGGSAGYDGDGYSLIVTDSVRIYNNEAGESGGAIYLIFNPTVDVGYDPEGNAIDANFLLQISGGEIYNNYAPIGGAIYIDDQAPKKVYFEGMGNEGWSGEYIRNVEISGGKVHDNYTWAGANTGDSDNEYGGAIAIRRHNAYNITYTQDFGSIDVSITGGEVYQNHAYCGTGTASYNGAGGALFIWNDFDLDTYTSGCNVSVGGSAQLYGNTCASHGAGIYLDKGNFSMTGGTIGKSTAHNVATNDGGGFYVNGGTVSVKGGIINYNDAGHYGGGFYVNPGEGYTTTINSTVATTQINNNTAINGGAAYVASGALEISSANTLVDSNTASTSGGCFYVTNGTVTVNEATLSNNSATTGHGGSLYASGGNVIFNSAVLSGNNAYVGNGGGAYITGGTVTMNGGLAANNIAGVNGGGLYVGNGDITVSGAKISGNSAANGKGGGIYAGNGNILVKDGAKIGTYTAKAGSGNTAKEGGGLYVNGGTVVFTGGTFAENYASEKGGGIYIKEGATLNLRETAELTGNHVPASGQGGGIYLDGTLNVGENADDPLGTHSLKVENNYAGETTSLNNVYLHDTDDVIRLLSDISGKDSGGNFYSHIGFSVDMGFRPVIYAPTEHINWLAALMGSTSSLVGSIFDDSQKYIAIHVNEYSAPFEAEYIYLWACWTTAVTSHPGNEAIELKSDGYYHIKRKEGLAWFTSLVNGLNHRPDDPYSNPSEDPQPNLKAVLEADVDMREFLWVPIGGVGSYNAFDPSHMSSIFTAGGEYKGEFDGQGHIISGLDCRYITAIESYGLFGNMKGGEVRNTFVKDYNFVTQDNGIDYLIGGIAGYMSAGVLRNCEAQGTVAASTCGGNTAVGGLVGLAETSAAIHSSMAMPYIAQAKASIATGGLVGKLAGTGTSLKNSFSNAKFGTVTHNVGGLVGDNSGTVENCYVRLQHETVPGNFYWFAAVNNGTVNRCYARNDAASDQYTTGTAAQNSGKYGITDLDTYSGKYGYNHQDQQIIDGNPDYVVNGAISNTGEFGGLLATLNNWVKAQPATGGYSKWTRTMASPMNGDYPILEFNDFVSAATTDNIFIAYRNNLDEMIDYANGNSTGGSVYLYGVPGTVTVANNANVKIFVNENIGFLQNVTLQNVRTGITLDNSSRDFMAYDWHMFSPALTDAPMGLIYNSMVSGYDIFDHYNTYLTTGLDNSVYGDVTKMDPPQTTWSTTTGQIGYFPTNTPYGPWRGTGSINDGFDFYCYSEPYTHWINFKREGNRAQEFYDHWHQDEDNNGKHWNIPYENETTMKRGKGYMVAITEPSMLMTDGTLDNNPVTVPVTNTTSLTGYEAPLKGVNLIGNPYQAYLDFNKIGNNLNTYFILDADARGYIAYVSDGSTPDVPGVVNANAPRYIHPHQGFFVHVPQGTTTLTLNNTMIQAGNGTSSFRSETNHYPMVNMAVEDERGRRDYTTVELDRPDQGGGEKIRGLHAGDASLWVRYGEKDWQVAFTKPGLREVPVRFEAYKDGTYTLSWETHNGYFSYLHLIDNLTGADIDCLMADEYRFEATTHDYTSRFRLVFDFTGVEENDEPTEGPTSFAFMMGDELVINGEGVLQMFDLNGRQLFSTEIHGTQATVAMPKVADGIYVLRLTNGNQVRTQKMVINK